MKRKYPLKMFLFGVLLNFFVRFFYLFLPGLILCIIGARKDAYLAIGLAFWVVDLIVSIVEQCKIRKAVLSDSENEEFEALMDAFYASGGPDAQQDPNFAAAMEEERRLQAESQEKLQALVVYRRLRELVRDGMTLEELVGAFEEMCHISVGEPDALLFQTGNFQFTGEKQFHFDLVRQFQFLDPDEYVQLHLTVFYAPNPKTALLRKTHWGEPEDGSFFETVRTSAAYQYVKDLPMLGVDVQIEET